MRSKLSWIAAAVAILGSLQAQSDLPHLTIDVVEADGSPAARALVVVFEEGTRFEIGPIQARHDPDFITNARGRCELSADTVAALRGSRRTPSQWRFSVPVFDAVHPFVVVDSQSLPASPLKIVLPPCGFIEVVEPALRAEPEAVSLDELLGWREIAIGSIDRMPWVKRRRLRGHINYGTCCPERTLDQDVGRFMGWGHSFRPAARLRVALGGFYGIRDTATFVDSAEDRTLYIRGPEAPGEVVRVKLPSQTDPSAVGTRPRFEALKFDVRPLGLPEEAVDLAEHPWAIAGERLIAGRKDFDYEPVLSRRLPPGPKLVCVRFGPVPPGKGRLSDAFGRSYSDAVEITANVTEDGRLELGDLPPPTSRPTTPPNEKADAIRMYRTKLYSRGFFAECRPYFDGVVHKTVGRALTVQAADGLPTQLATLWIRSGANTDWEERLPAWGGILRIPEPFVPGTAIVTSPSHEGVVLQSLPTDGVLRLRPRRVSRVTVRLAADVVLPAAPRALAVRLEYAGPADQSAFPPDSAHPFSLQLGGGMRFGADRKVAWFVREPGRYVVRLFLVDPIDGMYDVPPTGEPVTVAIATVEDEGAEVVVTAGFPDAAKPR